jgi:predicted O-methyltransferase YrrM
MSRILLIIHYIIQQLFLGLRGKAYPIAELHNAAWYSSKGKKLTTVSLESLFPGITSLPIKLEHGLPWVMGSLKLEELYVLCLICRKVESAFIFEFGTYNGRTTLNMAINTQPDSRIYTLDLPTPKETEFSTDKQDQTYQLGSQAGNFFSDSEYSNKIVQLWGDSAKFDETPYMNQVDLILIDASHTYEYVRNDTLKAMKMLRTGGIILWHDYTIWYPGVPRILHELFADYPIYHIEGTHLAILCSS